MYELAKSLRAKMKAKAKSLANEKDSKVDSSDWSPAEPLNADVKTGMRPISRSAYKAGGKVAGEATEPRADRQPRKKTGEVKSWVDAKVNRNVKDANEEREGIKHVGGLKKGGAAKKADGGRTGKNEVGYSTQKDANETPSAAEQEAMRKEMERQRQKAQEEGAHGRKDGGAAKKADGGFMNFKGDPVTPGMKKGGKTQSGRMQRKDGGRTKKAGTNVNIVITSGKPSAPSMGGPGMDAGPIKPPGGVPIPMPPPGMPPMPMGGMPMPPPAPPIGGGLPGGMPPMARRAGGRIARSYKDMDAGAGSGEGRLEKSEIQKRKR